LQRSAGQRYAASGKLQSLLLQVEINLVVPPRFHLAGQSREVRGTILLRQQGEGNGILLSDDRRCRLSDRSHGDAITARDRAGSISGTQGVTAVGANLTMRQRSPKAP